MDYYRNTSLGVFVTACYCQNQSLLMLLPWKNAHRLRDMIDVMDRTCVEIFESKKQALEGDEAVVEQMGQGKDITSILS